MPTGESERRYVVSFLLILGVIAMVDTAQGDEDARSNDGVRNVTRRGLVINEDNSHFMLYRPAEKMTVEGLHEFIDQYAETQVSHLSLCPNGMRVNYRTRAEGWESIWDGNDGENHPHQ